MFFSCVGVCVCTHVCTGMCVRFAPAWLWPIHPCCLIPWGVLMFGAGWLRVAWLCIRVLGGQRDTAAPAVPLEELGHGGRGREVPQLSHLSSLGLGFKLHNRKGLDQVAHVKGDLYSGSEERNRGREGSRGLSTRQGSEGHSGDGPEVRASARGQAWFCVAAVNTALVASVPDAPEGPSLCRRPG